MIETPPNIEQACQCHNIKEGRSKDIIRKGDMFDFTSFLGRKSPDSCFTIPKYADVINCMDFLVVENIRDCLVGAD